MAVFEVGAILEGIPVVKNSYHEELSKGDSTLRSGLFSAIQAFAKEAFGDETEELRLKNFTVCMKTFPLSKELSLVFYAIADKETRSIKAVRKALTKVIKRMNDLIQKPSAMKEGANAYVQSILDDEFKSLRMRSSDRARQLF